MLTSATHETQAFQTLSPLTPAQESHYLQAYLPLVRKVVKQLAPQCSCVMEREDMQQVALIGLLALPGYKTSYDARTYQPDWAPAKVGYAAAERHFSTARLNPEVLMIDTDKDLRTPAHMIVLERVAKEVFRTPGVAMVQSITRPLGTPLDNTSIPFQMRMQAATQLEALPFQPPTVVGLLGIMLISVLQVRSAQARLVPVLVMLQMPSWRSAARSHALFKHAQCYVMVHVAGQVLAKAS